jgi:hypothetical protein
MARDTSRDRGVRFVAEDDRLRDPVIVEGDMGKRRAARGFSERPYPHRGGPSGLRDAPGRDEQIFPALPPPTIRGS